MNAPAIAPLHLFIPDATPALHGPALPGNAPAELPPLPVLPQLDGLLRRMAPVETVTADEDCPASAFEIALARAHGLPDEPGRTPWAAFDSQTVGVPCAWLQPCHWQLGMDHALLVDPAELALTEAESRALLAACAPLLAEDGITLHYVKPDGWLAQGALFDGLLTWSTARAAGRPLTPTQLAQAPDEARQRLLRRLQNELQMWLHNQPVNDARDQARQLAVNALWIGGAGTLPAWPPTPARHIQVDERLGHAAPHDAAAWQALDADSAARLRQQLDAGADVRLTLCGPRQAITLAPRQGAWARFSSLFGHLRLSDLRKQL